MFRLAQADFEWETVAHDVDGCSGKNHLTPVGHRLEARHPVKRRAEVIAVSFCSHSAVCSAMRTRSMAPYGHRSAARALWASPADSTASLAVEKAEQKASPQS